MKTTEIEEIRAVVRRVREARHPELDPAFLDAVLDAEAAAGEDEAPALRRIRAAADAALGGTPAG